MFLNPQKRGTKLAMAKPEAIVVVSCKLLADEEQRKCPSKMAVKSVCPFTIIIISFYIY